MIISIENDQDKVVWNKELQAKLVAALDAVAKLENIEEDAEVDITIVDDEEIHQINREYRGVDRPTDVISFALDEDLEDSDEPELVDGFEEHLLGDILLSLETAQRQAEEYGHGIEREVAYLGVHSLLHLLGYDHMDEEEKAEMRQHEEAALRLINLSEEYFDHPTGEH